jgi:hypothetical protein
VPVISRGGAGATGSGINQCAVRWKWRPCASNSSIGGRSIRRCAIAPATISTTAIATTAASWRW